MHKNIQAVKNSENVNQRIDDVNQRIEPRVSGTDVVSRHVDKYVIPSMSCIVSLEDDAFNQLYHHLR